MSGLLFRLGAAVLLAGIGQPAAAAPSELEIAYQREFAYLSAEKEALAARRAELDRETARRAAEAEAELGALQARLVALRGEVGGQEELLASAVRDADTVTEASELVDATLFQATASLGIEQIAAETAEEKATALARLYEQGAEAIRTAGTVHKEPGSYFLEDGTKVEGEIVRVGRIAAYGVGPRSGALLPVGEGGLQLRDTEASGVAVALARGERPDPVGLFAFEDTGKRVEEAPPKTLASVVRDGGVVGLVILALGAVAVVLSALRAVGLSLAGRGQAEVTRALALLDQGDREGALAHVRSAPGATPRVVAAMLQLDPRDTSRLEDRGSEAILTETPKIEQFGTAIMVIAAVAPLLGLLGTVTGMIGTFEIITEFGTGDPRMLSGGISEALVTTQFGLVVAIPALLVGNLLNRSAERVLTRLETAALAVINRAPAPGGEDGEDALDGPAPRVAHA